MSNVHLDCFDGPNQTVSSFSFAVRFFRIHLGHILKLYASDHALLALLENPNVPGAPSLVVTYWHLPSVGCGSHANQSLILHATFNS